MTGAERVALYLPLLKDKRVAVVTNQTGVIGHAHLVDSLLALKVDLVKVFAPEHGFRGTADAGEHVASGRDERTGLPLVSLYGKNKKPSAEQLADVDVVLVLTDLRALGVRGPGHSARDEEDLADPGQLLGAEERYVAEELATAGKPTILAVNKIDLLSDKRLLLPLIDAWGKLHPLREIIPISAETGDGVDHLLDVLRAALPVGAPLFPADVLTDRPERFLVAELIREQVFLKTRQEVPYAVAVTIDGWQDRAGRRGERVGAVLDATVHVEKESQKKIIVGEGGRMIRDIGTAARQEIGELLGCGVHLQLFVRVDPDWTTRAGALRDFGYERHKPEAPTKRAERRPNQRPERSAPAAAKHQQAPPAHKATEPPR